jgi:hypothetical protein
LLLGFAGAVSAEPQWMKLPPTPVLPKAERNGVVPVNGVKIWYALFGHGSPEILLHGGLANPEWRMQIVDAVGNLLRNSG